jgi:amidohydrolase
VSDHRKPLPPILAAALEIKDEIVSLRRTIHQHPELGKKEFLTSKLVEDYLQALGLETRRAAGTGVIGLLRGGQPGKTVAFRADMDALPIQEMNPVSYQSKVPGIMHACGHDAHTAALLGAAKLLTARREALIGNVKFFFQPNEELEGGAAEMIMAGCMEDPKVDAVFGCHVAPWIPAGKIAVSYGICYAASNPFVIEIRGKASHGAEPHLGIDAIVIGSHIVTALQTLISRTLDPVDPAVITVGSFHGGNCGNVIADAVRLEGMIRTLDPNTRELLKEKLRQTAEGIGCAMGAKVKVQIEEGFPAMITDTAMTDFLKAAASSILGQENVTVSQHPTMGTEDFSYFLQKAPGTFFQLGVGDPFPAKERPLHNGYFDIDEQALPLAAAIHTQAALNFLSSAMV